MTEIDEEIMQSVTALIVGQIERAWQTLNLVPDLGPSASSLTQIQQVFMANDRLVLLMFEIDGG
jgi:flagellar motor switch protein FliM